MSLSTNNPISIVSYNARGFRSGQAFIKELLHDCDVLCLQEHWLLSEHLSDLNVCDDFTVTGVSGMDSESFIRGRPFGGCAIAFRKSLSSMVSVRQVSSSRFCAIHVKSDCQTLLLVCVYMPFDNGLTSGHLEFQEALGELEGFLDAQDFDSLAVVGDFNVDFRRTDRHHTSDLLLFMDRNSLIAKDLDFEGIQFTYESDDGARRSWVDHVLVSSSFCIEYVRSLLLVVVQTCRIIVQFVPC